MKTKVLLIVMMIAVIIGCKKDSLATKPKIKVESISTNTLNTGQNLRVILEFADKEGDISNSIFIRKVRLNQRFSDTVIASFSLPMPSMPNNQRGEIMLDFTYEQMKAAINPPSIPSSNPPVKEPDTLILKLALKDLAGNVSDTISTPQFQVIR